ncbi:MAG: Coenzyme F420 hydrogenase/dehydrogenase, beta subunit C-terminal domain, partial [Promethearchaeota archaeon]
YMRQACSVCKDFTNIYADISFGGLGSPDKFTTVITRTQKGKDIVHKTLNKGIIKPLKLDINDKKKMIEKITQFSQSKIKRTETNMKNKMITWNSK